MIKHYIKSAVKQAKADRLFTAIYIVGVTLAIATTLVMSMVYYIRIAPISPEVNRADTYYLFNVAANKENQQYQTNLCYTFIKNELKGIDGVKVAATTSFATEDRWLHASDEIGDVQVSVKEVDNDFFNAYDFVFKEGEPLAAEDVDGSVTTAVITDDLARYLFGSDSDIVGRNITVDNIDYRIKGVVKGTSPLTEYSYAQIYIPAIISEVERTGDSRERVHGGYVAMLVIDEDDYDMVRQRLVQRFAELSEPDGWVFELSDVAPLRHMKNVIKPYARTFSWWDALKENLLILMVLLLVPALNLCGLISGRMDARVGELGLRKAFGARRGEILSLVLSENLIYTLMGGALGLILAIVIVMIGNLSIFNLLTPAYNQLALTETATMTLRPEMFLSFTIFIVALAVCVVLNLISAFLPAWIAVRRPIVNSLNEKKTV